LARFSDAFRGMPICSISGDLPGVPNVVADNQSGVRAALSHLVRTHDRRKIAFVRGPIANQDADERYRAYVDGLSEHAIALDASRVASGDFTFEGGVAAVEALLDGQQADLDALMAADDSMALGVLAALRNRKISVPDQIAVIGFDDVDEARFSVPSLTTVRQPLKELGAEAVRILHDSLQGRRESDHRVVLPTTSVLRKSCGCFGPQLRPRGRAGTASPSVSFNAELVARRDAIRAELVRASQGTFGVLRGWDDRMIEAFAEQLRTESDRFSSAFATMVGALLESGVDVGAVHLVLTVFRTAMLDCVGHDALLRGRAEDMFQEARLAAGEAAERAQARRRSQTERTASALSSLSRRLLTVASVPDLRALLSQQLDALGIDACTISVFEKAAEPSGMARLLVGWDSGEAEGSPSSDGDVFGSRLLAPRARLSHGEPRAFVVLPLHFAGQDLGVLLLAYRTTPAHVFETLGEMIGAAVYRALHGVR
jgi:sigma-B regulation protein RsbU (phosphoserine phosphatase)